MDKNQAGNLKMIQDYKQMMVDGLRHTFTSLHENELREAIDYSINKRIYSAPASIDNNYTKRRIDGDILDVIHYIETLEPIVTSSGVLFKKHKEADNPMAKMIMGFLDKRSEYKKEMFKHPKGSAEFERYNLLQLLEKLNANATYGVLGAPTSMLYNIYTAESVTRQGRSYISCSIMLFESFLANNVGFNSLNEVIGFINNVEHEKPERKLLDSVILDRNITREECFYKLMNTVDYTNVWVPTEKEMGLVWDYLQGVTQEDINRIFYKNNLYTFCELPIMQDLIIKILCELDEPFMNPNKPPKIIQDDLDTLTSILKEYVYYGYFYTDKLDRIDYMQRDIVIVSDTDSTIISFDAWYRYVLSKVYNIDMPIKHRKFNMVNLIDTDEYGDKPKRTMCTIIEPEYDYDFYTDEVIEIHKLREPCKLVPQDSLRYSIINIMAYVCSDLVVDYLARYVIRANAGGSDMGCKMIMKNEFLFDRLLLTANRRNYADIQTLQEGNIIPKGMKTSMAIMGLPINKSTLSDGVKQKMQEILYEDVLTADKIDQVKIMKQLALLEHSIYENVMSKKTDYYKPDNVKAISYYAKNPLEVNGVVAIMVYNEMRDETMSAIDLNERNKIIKIKLNVNKKNVHKIKDKYPVEYEKLCRLLEHPTLGSKLGTIALPIDAEVPDWVLEFVDIQTIVSDVLKNFPLDSIGLRRCDNDSVNYSNIIQL